MPTVYFSPVGNGQFETSAGVPATGSVVKTYVAGTTTPLATYSDSGGTTANSTTLTVNSLGHLTSSGVAVQVWVSQATKFVWETAGGAVLRTWDNVPGINTITPAEWVASGLTPTYVGATQFTVPGDQTSVFTVPRSLRITQTAGTTYGGYVSASSHSSGTTTVTVTGATVDSGISAVDYSFANPAYPSIDRLSAHSINSLAEDANPDRDLDFAMIYDASATAHKKVQVQNLGRLVQRVEATPYTAVQTTTANIPYDDTIPQSGEGTEWVTASITPKKTTNRLIIRWSIPISQSANNVCISALFQDATADALAVTSCTPGAANFNEIMTGYHEMAAGTTSATTFKLRAGSSAGSMYVNGDSTGRKFGGTLAVRLSIEEYE